MESLRSKEWSMRPSGVYTYFNYGPRSYKHLQKWQNLSKDNLELQWPLQGMSQLVKIVH